MTEIEIKNLNELKKVMENYGGNYDYEMVEKAFNLCVTAHAGQKRVSGEDYYYHPFNVAKIVISLGMDSQSIVAALLHDVVEDTDISLKTIEKTFGQTVAKLVDGVTKIASLSKTEKLTENDSIKRLLLAMGEDVRVIFIKLADRLHNMRTIEFLARHRQIAISKETQELFIPIAERIGLRNIRAELEALTFKCLNPEEYVEIKAYQDKRLAKHAESIAEVERIIKESLVEKGIQPDVIWWPEKYYSLYKKSNVQGFGKMSFLSFSSFSSPSSADSSGVAGFERLDFLITYVSLKSAFFLSFLACTLSIMMMVTTMIARTDVSAMRMMVVMSRPGFSSPSSGGVVSSGFSSVRSFSILSSASVSF